MNIDSGKLYPTANQTRYYFGSYNSLIFVPTSCIFPVIITSEDEGNLETLSENVIATTKHQIK